MESRIAGRAYLASIAVEARTGSLRLLCPFCDGGPEREVSLVLTIRDDGAFYCCHRATCGAKGALGQNARRFLESPGSKIQAKPTRLYTADLYEMRASDLIMRRFAARPWGPLVDESRPSSIGLYTDYYKDKEVWILRNLLGERVAVQTRWKEDGKKRVMTYKETDGDVYTAYECLRDRQLKPTWIVEDPMSAALIGSWSVPAVSLCGTFLSQRLAIELMSQELYTSGFVVALDPGAEGAAMRVRNTLLSVATVPVEIRYTTCDIKDMSEVHLLKTLGLEDKT